MLRIDHIRLTSLAIHAARNYWLEVNPVGATNGPTNVPEFPIIVGWV